MDQHFPVHTAIPQLYFAKSFSITVAHERLVIVQNKSTDFKLAKHFGVQVLTGKKGYDIDKRALRSFARLTLTASVVAVIPCTGMAMNWRLAELYL